ncbi:MAG: sigma-70 family RNA polymerase sigma factor [Hypericibacter sp.]
MAGESLEREALGRLVAELRPRLHRYCARMVGSAFDGEDVVQEALAKAIEAYPAAGRIERPESWLFRIAHNTALDALRRRNRQALVRSDIDMADMADASAVADVRVAAAASLATLMRLPVAQRSCVVLMDVLGHSLAETAEILDLTLPAVKAALHRARTRLQEIANAPDDPAPTPSAAERERLRHYADRFNARDFDALRNLLAEDVRLDLVNRTRLAGRKDVSVYFTRYSEISNWRVSVGSAEGRLALLVNDPADQEDSIRYVVLLDWTNGRIAAIRDFHYATYVMESLAVSRL